MSTVMSKAMVAKVDFGFVQIEGLLLPNESYGVSAQQANKFLQFSVNPNNTSKALKSLLSIDLQSIHKAKTETSPKLENVLSLPQFNLLIVRLACKGNKTAQAFLEASALETIERRFDTAFGKKVDEEKRNLWLKARVEGKTARRSLTDAVQDYLLRHNHDPKGNYAKFQVYAKFTDAINCAVLGKTAKELKDELKMTASQVLRDEVDCPELSKIKEIERYAAILIDKQDTHPVEAVEQAILFYS